MLYCQPEISFEPWVLALVWISLFKTKNYAEALYGQRENSRALFFEIPLIRHERKYS